MRIIMGSVLPISLDCSAHRESGQSPGEDGGQMMDTPDVQNRSQSSQEIDLYDETIEHDFNSSKDPDSIDDYLLDESVCSVSMIDCQPLPLPESPDVLNQQDAASEGMGIGPMSSPEDKRSGPNDGKWIYIGNLTWWTSDEDIEDAFHHIGVFDLIEIRIAERKSNGMSKGYCEVNLQSEKSINEIQTKLGKIHDRMPLVFPRTIQSLAHLEGLASANGLGSTSFIGKGKYEQMPINRQVHTFSRSASNPNGQPTETKFMANGVLRNSPNQNSSNYNDGMPFQAQLLPPPLRFFPMRPFPGNNIYPPRQQMYRPRYGGPPYSKYGGEQVRMNHRSTFPIIPINPPPQNNCWRLPHFPAMHQVPPCPFPPGPNRFPLIQIPPGAFAPLDSSTNRNSPGSHTSPDRASDCREPDNYRSRHSSPLLTPPPLDSKMTEAYEGLMARNRIVSGSAIERAVKDAGSGDYASAIETLVTAISLLKQSRVAADDRCKILITSLQDTLHGVESRSYGGNKRRSRSRSPTRRHSGSCRHTHRYYHKDPEPSRARTREWHDRDAVSRRSRSISPAAKVSRNFTHHHDA
jgi:cleavage and polyadenylation specificity factor subunit 6/7